MRSRELQIVTPEAVVLNLPTAGLGSRFVARGLDVLIQGFLVLILLVATSVIASALTSATGGGTAGTVAFVVFLVLMTFIWLGYAIVLETLWRGKTPGKAALGLRVVTNEGAPIRFRHALVRGVLALVDVWMSFGSVGVLTILVSTDEQRFGDMAAGTIVVRDRSGARAPSATVFAPPPGCEEYVAHLDVSGIDPAGYEAARSFLLRAGALAPAARAHLAAQLATPLLHRLRHIPPPWMGPDLWLACLAAAYQRRHGGGWPSGYPGSPGGWPAAGYPRPGYVPPPGYAPGFPAPSYPPPPYAPPGSQSPGYQSPGYQSPGYQSPGYQLQGDPGLGYQSPGYQLQGDPAPGDQSNVHLAPARTAPGDQQNGNQPPAADGRPTIADGPPGEGSPPPAVAVAIPGQRDKGFSPPT
jgi:uncharacterized RDD family membrane protein YckC